jgi:hypothetical protein
MDGRPYQYAFDLRLTSARALVIFRALPDDSEAVADELATLIAEELHEDRVRPDRWAEPRIAPLDAKLPALRLGDVRARRVRLVRRVVVSDGPSGRHPVGLVHPIGFWVMFPCDSEGSAERLVDRLSP